MTNYKHLLVLESEDYMTDDGMCVFVFAFLLYFKNVSSKIFNGKLEFPGHCYKRDGIVD